MTTVNIANNDWQWQRETSTIKITANSTYINFNMGDDLTDEMAYAKACITIDASKYETITLEYNNKHGEGNTDLEFGVYNSMSPSSSAVKVGTSSWNTSGSVTIDISDLSGTKYVGFRFYGNTYTFNEYIGWEARQRLNITSLTAVESGYTLTYDANGGSGAPSAVSNITSTTISSVVPTRSGYDFLGWSTSSYATSASYVAGDTITLTSATTLYAVWRKFYTVTYDANGGSNAPSSDKKISGQTLTLNSTSPTPPEDTSVTYTVTFNANGGTCNQDMMTVTNITTYKFVNWNTSSNGYGTSYQSGGSYVYDNDVTLYAQYTHTTTYNSVSLPIPTRNNYDFLGWSTNEYDTSGIIGEYTPTGDVTLYAIWKIKGQVYIRDNTEDFSPYKALIYDGSGWNQYVPYIYTYSGWEVYSG
jgi:uncharacterized repeat protein (TIGR02543 family)